MTKKMLSLVLTILMVLSLAPMASLAQEDAYDLTIAVNRTLFDQTEVASEKAVWIAAEEMTGVKIKWIEILEPDRGEKIPLLLSGGDLPDVFMMGLPDNIITENPELFVPIQDLIEENCPNIMQLYNEKIPDWRTYLTYPDGNIYGLMGGYYTNPLGLVGGTQWINVAWLDQLGMDVPTTLDEFYDVLVAFRDNDMDGDGDATNEIPLEICQNFYGSKVIAYASMWGLPIYENTWYMIEDGEVVNAVDTPAFREFLEYFHMLGQEGLIDLEGFSMTNEQLNSNIASGKVGTLWHWEPTMAAWPANPEKWPDYQPMAPIAAEGYEAKVCGNPPISAARNNFVITTACEDPAAALRWYDAISEHDFSYFAARYKENHWWFFDSDGNMVGRQPSNEELAEWGFEPGIDLGTLMYGQYHPLVYAGLTGDLENQPESYNARRFRSVLILKDYIAPTMTQQIMTAETNEELTFMTDGLNDYINGFIASSILNGVTDASWDEYVAGLETYGYSFYIEWYNAKYHGAQ